MDSQNIRRFLLFGGLIVAALFLVRMFNKVDTIVPENILIVAEDSAVLYAKPDVNSYELVRFDKGDKVELLEEDKTVEGKEWLKVGNGPFTGYIRAQLVVKSARFNEQK